MHSTLSRSLAAALLSGALMLGACSKVDEGDAETETAEASSDTLAAALEGAEGMETLSTAMTEAQLASLLDGTAPYTLLAPTDEAFAALEADGERLMAEQQQPVLVAVLRDHILPGHVTTEAIAAAIAEDGSPVEMTTYGGGTVTFAGEGDELIVSTGERRARISGETIGATNGVLIPIDAVLLPAPAEGGEPAQ